jgi:hypothetical protein
MLPFVFTFSHFLKEKRAIWNWVTSVLQNDLFCVPAMHVWQICIAFQEGVGFLIKIFITKEILPTGRPDRANFRPLGYCFCWDVFLKITKVAKNLGLLFSAVKVTHYFWQKIGWATFGRHFHKLIWSPCLPIMMTFHQIKEHGALFPIHTFVYFSLYKCTYIVVLKRNPDTIGK